MAHAADAANSGAGCFPGTSGWDFSLRSDFNDLGPLTCPHGLVSAQGATLSLGNNLLTGQYSASADGLAALAYRYYGEENSDLYGASFGPFVQGDDTYQFEPSKSQTPNGDTITAGGFGEVASKNPFARSVGGIDDFRIRGGEVLGSTRTTSDSLVGEYIPSYQFPRPFTIGNTAEIGDTPLLYTFSPEVMVQYDLLESGPNKYMLFSSKNEALRVGPEVVFNLYVDKRLLPSDMPKAIVEFLANSSALHIHLSK